MRKTKTIVVRSVLVFALSLLTACSFADDTRLPIIPGAAGYGMETPAGSGRHLDGLSLEPGWEDALVGHWNFEDGLPADGKLTGDASIVERDGGHALRLKGKGMLTFSDPEGYVKPGDSFTIMAWVYMEAPLGVVAENVAEDAGHWRLAHVRHGVGKWMFKAEDDEKAGIYRPLSVDEPKWRCVTGVYDGSTGRMRLYINETMVGDTRNRGVKDLAAARSENLTLGRGIQGMIDDVMLFDTALTYEQILAHYARGHSAYFGPKKTTVYKVTNLNTEGPGSLRAALEAVGPRVVVFEVSGNIDFTPHGSLYIGNPYVTVAGQTAPSPGITLNGCELHVRTHDVLLQHIRIRMGDLPDPEQAKRYEKSDWTQFSERDCLKLGGERVVVDHCTFSWATDELVQSTALGATFRQNIFAECLDSPKHHKGGHSKALLIPDQTPRERRYCAVIGNLFAHNADRHPAAQGGTKLVHVNNFIYDATRKPGVGLTLSNGAFRGDGGGPIRASVIANHFDRVPAPLRFISRPLDVDGEVYLKDFLVTYTPAELREYEKLIRKTVDEKQFKDYLEGKEKPAKGENEVVHEHLEDPWDASHMLMFRWWMGERIYPLKSKVQEPPLVLPGLEIKPAREVRNWVLATAGARPADRDAVDARVVKQVRDRTGQIIQSQGDVGGWPELERKRRKLTVPDNPSADDDGDGYTNLEEWLHSFSAEVEGKAGS